MAEGVNKRSEFWSSLDKRIHAEWLGITLFTVVVTMLLSLYGESTRIAHIDHTFYDSVLQMQHHPDVGDDIVIIAIDDSSIEQLGHWPWRRTVHAQLLEQLSEARVVGFDIVFSEPNSVFPEDDATLAAAIKKHGRVVLPAVIQEESSGGPRLQSPVPLLAEAAAHIGYINVYPDIDGTVRSLTLQRKLSLGKVVNHFSLPLLGLPPATDIEPDKQYHIPYAGPAGHFPFYPFAAVLNGDIPAEYFRDRTVLIGAWGSGLGDTFPTPMTRAGETMSGVEVLANGLMALKQDNWIHTLPASVVALLSALPILLACLAFRRLSPRYSFLVSLAILLTWSALTTLLLIGAQLWLPPTAGLIGIVIAFPLWSWRSQEASLKHIDKELHALQEATGWVPVEGEDRIITYDRSLPTRVRLLHQAIARFRHAQQKREETLRFLSHDMRAPQNAILALIEMQRREPHARTSPVLLKRIEQRATDTLELMDGFVQLERAEVAAIEHQAIELTDLVQEACDACWELARPRHISLETHHFPEQAWVSGDRKLLARVLRNLLDNAIKYSADHTTVRCSIERHGGNWDICIQDQGRGIPADKLDRIFEPFTRVVADFSGETGGAGLGLAFARTTLQRHRGTITATSQEGRGSRFTVSLPVLNVEQAD